MRNFAASLRNHFIKKKWVLVVGAGCLALASSPRVSSELPPGLNEVRSRAEQGDEEAQNALGNAYATGKSGVPQDYAEAFKWYLKSAEKGYAPAEFNLGQACELGHGVAPDEAAAFKYYLRAAEQGFPAAQFNVGNMYASGRGVAQDIFEANIWYRQAADKGVVEAQFNLGMAYDSGRGIKKDEVQAAHWYRLAADRGFTRAQYNLGLLYEDGRGVAKEDATAAGLYRSAAEQGFAAAQNNYGVMMAEGRGGLTKDPVQAFVWLSLAVENGAPPDSRDHAAPNLTAEEMASANRQLAERHSGKAGSPLAAEHQDANTPHAGAPASNENPSSVVVTSTGSNEPADHPGLDKPPAKDPEANTDPQVLITHLRSENGRLNDELELSMRELVTLTEQLRDLKKTPVKSSGADPVVAPADQTRPLSARVHELETQLQQAQARSSTAQENEAKVKELLHQVQVLQSEKAELEKRARALEKSASEKSVAVQTRDQDVAGLRDQIAQLKKQRPDAEPAAPRVDSIRAKQASDSGTALRTRNEKLTKDNQQLTASAISTRHDLDQAQARVGELEKKLGEMKNSHTAGDGDNHKMEADLAEANQAIEKLNGTVAEITATNERLEKDLENSRKSTEAALAAQSQAVSATQPDAYKMEINTLQARVKDLEGEVEDDRANAAHEVATLASQLQHARASTKALLEANHALEGAKQAEQPVVSKDELDQLQARMKDVSAITDDLKKQNQKLADNNQRLLAEQETAKQQLEDARKVATLLPGLSDEKVALQERLEAIGAQLVKAQQDVENLQKQNSEANAQAAASKQAAEKAQADLTAGQARTVEAEKAVEAHSASVAELTDANTKLQAERDDLRQQLETLRTDNSRLTATAATTQQLKTDSERNAQESIEALSAQLGQTRRDLQAARESNSRLVSANLTQERERAATVANLRQENASLSARLTQAQSTLDQIASAARLGTPASTIASGGTIPSPPVVTPADKTEIRLHTVAEGDSLSRISMRYYGTPNRWQEIFQANRDLLQASSTLRVGMQLRIP